MHKQELRLYRPFQPYDPVYIEQHHKEIETLDADLDQRDMYF